MKTPFLLFVFLLSFTGVILHAQTPSITSFTPTSGPVGTLVAVKGKNMGSPAAFTIGGKPAVVVSSTATRLVGMVMPGAVTGGLSVTTAGGTATFGVSFTVKDNYAPTTPQGNYLTSPYINVNAASPAQGTSVAISADGATAAVGMPGDDGQNGAVQVYKLSNGQWVPQGGKLFGPSSSTIPLEGTSVAISADGNTVLVGAPSESTNGAAFVFIRQADSTWVQQGGRLVGSDFAGDQSNFGTTVALSADGNTAAIGAPYDNDYTGATWVFVRVNGVWTQQGNKLTTTVTPSAQQGISVALSAGGNTLFSCAYNDARGSVVVYTRSGTSWSQLGSKIVLTSPADGQQFGYSVALSADANTAVIGGYYPSGHNGRIWIYTRSGDAWLQSGPAIMPAFTGNNSDGSAVSISADGKTVAIGNGQNGYDDDSSYPGAVWVYKLIAGVWTQQENKIVVNSTNARFGTSVALSATGSSMIAGAPEYLDGKGAAFVYTGSEPPTITSFSPAFGPAGTLVTVKGANLAGAISVIIGGKPAILTSATAGSVTAMVMPGTVNGTITVKTAGNTIVSAGTFNVTAYGTPAAPQGGRISATDLVGTSNQGTSVAVSADGATAIVGGANDGGDIGAAWVYKLRGTVWVKQSNKLLGTGTVGSGIFQGKSVSISADGNTAIVGGYGDNSLTGAAWIYIRQADSSWVQQGPKLTGTGLAGAARFGYSVSLSANGNTAAIGGYSDSSNVGATWIFKRNGGTWAQEEKKLVGTGATGAAQQGWAVALSADGNTVITGAPNDNTGAGTAWIFVRGSTAWGQVNTKLTFTGNVGAPNFGSSVSINADGTIAVVGGSADDGGKGAAWVFNRVTANNNTVSWAQFRGKITGAGLVGNANLGYSAAISADGGAVILGGPADNVGKGAVWTYKLINGFYTQAGNKIVSTDAIGIGKQGTSVAISASGLIMLEGGPGHKDNKGAAWAFVAAPTPVITSFSPAVGTVGTVVTITGTSLNGATGLNIGGKPALIFSNTNTKLVAMVMPGAITDAVIATTAGGTSIANGTFTVIDTHVPSIESNRLSAPDLVGNSNQGLSVAISADGKTAIVGAHADDNFAGAAWVYKLQGATWVLQSSKLIGTGAVGSTVYQGKTVAISADGNTAIVGGFGDNNIGAAWIFTRQADSTWAQQGPKLTATDVVGNAGFGYSVAISGTGNTAVITGYHDDGSKGATWVFTRSGTTWTQLGS